MMMQMLKKPQQQHLSSRETVTAPRERPITGNANKDSATSIAEDLKLASSKGFSYVTTVRKSNKREAEAESTKSGPLPKNAFLSVQGGQKVILQNGSSSYHVQRKITEQT